MTNNKYEEDGDAIGRKSDKHEWGPALANRPIPMNACCLFAVRRHPSVTEVTITLKFKLHVQPSSQRLTSWLTPHNINSISVLSYNSLQINHSR